MAGLLDQYQGMRLSDLPMNRRRDRSVMDQYSSPETLAGLLAESSPRPEDDAIGPPSVLGGLLSLDPTDYIGPRTLGKLAMGAKALAGPAMLGGLLAMGRSGASVPSRMRQSGAIMQSGLAKELSSDIAAARVAGSSKNFPNGGMFWPDSGGYNGSSGLLANGNYLAQLDPAWPVKGKTAFAVSDSSIDEAQAAANALLKKSTTAKSAADQRKFDNSFAGRLQKMTGDEFRHTKSARSDSTYATHSETGAKIRISDHALPSHYESADLDIPSWLNKNEQLAIIQKYIAAKKNGDEDAAWRLAFEVGKRRKE